MGSFARKLQREKLKEKVKKDKIRNEKGEKVPFNEIWKYIKEKEENK